MSQGKRSRELSPWVDNFFSTTLFGNRRPSTDHSWNGFEFRRFISFFILFAVDGFDGPRAIRIDLFRLFGERWIQLVQVQAMSIIIATCDCSRPARSCELA